MVCARRRVIAPSSLHSFSLFFFATFFFLASVCLSMLPFFPRSASDFTRCVPRAHSLGTTIKPFGLLLHAALIRPFFSTSFLLGLRFFCVNELFSRSLSLVLPLPSHPHGAACSRVYSLIRGPIFVSFSYFPIFPFPLPLLFQIRSDRLSWFSVSTYIILIDPRAKAYHVLSAASRPFDPAGER